MVKGSGYLISPCKNVFSGGGVCSQNFFPGFMGFKKVPSVKKRDAVREKFGFSFVLWPVPQPTGGAQPVGWLIFCAAKTRFGMIWFLQTSRA